jgi:hypothetical protein
LTGEPVGAAALAAPAWGWRRAAQAILLGGLLALLGMAYSVQPRLVEAGDPGTGGALIGLTNQDRTSNGLGALAANGSLSSIATSAGGSCGGVGVSGRSADMINRQYFSHQIPPCGGYVWTVFGLGAYSAAAENIGWNNGGGPGAINTAFMNSSEHRSNILGNYNQMGAGAWSASGSWMGYGGVTMYTEIFILGPGGAPAPPPPPPAPPPPGGGGFSGSGGSDNSAAPAPAAPAPSPSPSTCSLPVELGETDRNSPAPSLTSDGGQPPCPSPNLAPTAKASASPAPGQGTGNEVVGTDREAAPKGLLETVIDQVLRLFLNV